MSKEIKTSEYVSKVKEISGTLEGLVLDMTKELRESEQRYRSIVEFASDAIITMNNQKKVTSWNQGATAIFGYTEQEANGQVIDLIVAKDQLVHEAETLSKRVLQGESLQNLQAMRFTKSGEPRNVLISAAPIFDQRGEVIEVSLMYKDITELKRAHEQLVQTEKQATLGIIAGNIGHELNNLVGGLMVHSKLLLHYTGDPEKIKETSDILSKALEKIALHAKNLLSLSKPTKPQFEPLDLNAILVDTTETLILSGVLKRFKIIKNLCGESCYVEGDRNLIEQVIRNLEINSAHAMRDNGILTVETRKSSDQKYVELVIGDNGAGIPFEVQDKIFQPFFTTKPEGQGTGLGLPIVKDIVKKHKGYINLSSAIGQGTQMTVGLPIAR